MQQVFGDNRCWIRGRGMISCQYNSSASRIFIFRDFFFFLLHVTGCWVSYFNSFLVAWALSLIFLLFFYFFFLLKNKLFSQELSSSPCSAGGFVE